MNSNLIENVSVTATTTSIFIPENNSYLCENDVSLQMARVICTQILMPLVCIVGVAGNVLNIVVLTTATMRSSTSCYLCAVAVYDLLYSLTGLPLTLRTFSSLEMSATYMNALTYLLPLGNMWSNITAWLTCTFTIERFMAISTPIRSRKNFTIRRTQWNIVFVSFLIALITLPDFFERRIRAVQRTCVKPEQSGLECDVSSSPCVEMFYVLEATSIGIHLERFGWSYANVALFVFFPLIILAIFNALLIKSVIKAYRERNKMLATSIRFERERGRKSAPPTVQPSSTRKELAWRKWWITRQYYQQNSARGSPLSIQAPTDITSDENTFNASMGTVATTSGDFMNTTFQSKPPETPYCFRWRKRDTPRKHDSSITHRSSHQNKQSITIMLIAVVVVFCVLNAPSAVVHLIRPWFKNSDSRLKAFGNVSNLLLMLNASLNFFLYSLFSARFRRSLRTLLKSICVE
ncbi:hypothetical protein Aperf_G00000062631 [Anoplocephala perfoliata]